MKSKLVLILMVAFTINLVAQNPMEYIGIEHNKGLRYVFNEISELPEKEKISNTINVLLRKKYSEEACKDLDKILSINSYSDLVTATKEMLDPEFHTLLIKINNEILLTPSKTLEIVASYEKKAKEVVNNENLMNFYSYLSVAKHSYTYWTTEVINTIKEKYGITILLGVNDPNDEPEIKARRIKGYKVFLSDCLGMMMGSGGGPPGAIVGGIGMSANNALGQWLP